MVQSCIYTSAVYNIIISLSLHTYVLKKCCSSHNEDVHYTVDNGTLTCKLEKKVCPDCDPCYTAWKSTLKSGVLAVGSFGLIFSFTQASIIILLLISTVLYRVSFRWDICPQWRIQGGFEGFDRTPLLDGPSTKQVLMIG